MQPPPPLILLEPVQFADAGLRNQTLRLLREAAESVQADEATLWGLTADGQHLRGLLSHGASQKTIEGLVVPVADSLAGTTFLNRKTLRLGATELSNAMSSYVSNQTGTGIHAMLAAPVRVRTQMRGALTAVRTRQAADFTEANADEVAWKAFLLGLVIGAAGERQES